MRMTITMDPEQVAAAVRAELGLELSAAPRLALGGFEAYTWFLDLTDGTEVVLRVVSVDRHRGIVRVSRANSQGKFAFIPHPEFDKATEAA